MTNKFLAAAGLAGLISLAGCATPERFVLLPQADGSPSAIVVHVRGGEAVLSTPYAAAEAVPDKVSPVQVTEAEVRARYQAVYAADPPRARSYLLYFESGANRLTPESEAQLAAVLSDIKQVPAPELMVIGHTDSVGSDEVNDPLSLKRAEVIKELLAASGVQTLRIEAVGRGKRDPLVPVGDNVAEPKNRRVELRLR